MAKGVGRFGWHGRERRTDRYGGFVLDDPRSDAFTLSVDDLSGLEGQRVRITATVLESRQSGHIGDMFLGIGPTTPAVGEVIQLGVGTLMSRAAEWDSTLTEVFLVPDDERDRFWMDPRLLYRLHDQTVEITFQPTTDPCHPAPVLRDGEEQPA